MSIKEQISADIKTAMKSKDSVKLMVLRGLSSSFSNKEIELRSSGKEATDEDYLKVVASEAKKRKDSIEAFTSGGRADLADKEKVELEILSGYLPTQMSREEAEAKVKSILESNPEAKTNIGQAMKLVMAEIGQSADGKMISELVRQFING
ncbi:MAG: glutamyl-tRNA amidotransferase [Candidatus Harrisonbacteria bacterium CG10_big_fil_rev_8_21_14_0_10_45_28]|uniref:Glutamyl-tRNA amidotransferase n=1 Tax=Candidatus Harrisonbacteria bacterium CG10_big_fil_rev_8_21_14_0_10_45_28 TaxID=1974586 RepID=A0A2H0UMU6_9BACT|nr:MAG: glutamyl-tRNA amidotransferase [Candidatus Harrisonbacteria bacterium CG10_big_fil_rev_8_21_14_0_10_45_28]